MNEKAIGVFDSGLGGLSIWRELIKTLPNESVVYYADSANCPYGPKSKDEIIVLSTQIVDFLLSLNVKLIIVACNTATAAAIDYLRENYDIPFIGIEPAIKPAALNSKSKSVAVLATEGTFNGRLFQETQAKFAKDTKVHVIVGKGLVEIVENDQVESEESYKIIEELLSPLQTENIDHLVLGCTHYPFLEPQIKKILLGKVEIINPAEAVVRQTKSILISQNLLATRNKPEYSFYSSGDNRSLEGFVKKIYKGEFKINE